LIRSLGNIYGVTITSAIVQNVLVARLPEALRDVENRDKVLQALSVYDTVRADETIGHRKYSSFGFCAQVSSRKRSNPSKYGVLPSHQNRVSCFDSVCCLRSIGIAGCKW